MSKRIKEKTKRITTNLSEKEFSQFQEFADQEHLKPAILLRKILLDYLETYEYKKILDETANRR